MIWFLSLFTREYEQRLALLIIFLASSFWGVLWVPMRYIEAMGLSGLWVVVLFHFLPALAMLPLISEPRHHHAAIGGGRLLPVP